MTVKQIELHPGHWSNTGSGANGILNEVTEARKVTKRVYEILKASNVPVTYFEDNTSTNKRDNINTLVKHHNADRDALVVSIHFNASNGTHSRGIGTEVLYYDQKVLAEKIAKAISDASGLINRGAKQRKDLGVLASTYETAILIEVCFVNSTVDAAIYKREFEKICQAIAKVLAEYLGKSVSTANTSIKPANTVDKGGKEVAQQFLNETGRNECKEMIRRGVEEKLFHDKHENVDQYTDVQLLSYAIAYQNRKLK